jgi:hypothetical protein
MGIRESLLKAYETQIQKIANKLWVSDDNDLIEIFNCMQPEDIERVLHAAQSVLDRTPNKREFSKEPCSRCNGGGCDNCESY